MRTKAGRMKAAAAARAPGGSAETVAHIGGQLHYRSPGHHLAQGQPVQKLFLVQPALFRYDSLPDGLHHGQAAVGGGPQIRKVFPISQTDGEDAVRFSFREARCMA